MVSVQFIYGSVNVPESLEELAPEQYLRLIDIDILLRTESLPLYMLQSKVLSVLLDTPTDLMCYPERAQREAARYCYLADPFISEDGKSLQLFTDRNLLPGWKGFSGPGDMLDGVSFGTFCECMALVRSYQQEDTEESMHAMRQVGKLLYVDGRGSIPPMTVCYHANVLFLNIFRIMSTEPVNLNGDDVDFRILFQPSGRPAANDHTGWTGIAMDVAESGVFGNYREVCSTPMWDVLLYLYRKRFQSLQEKKEAK